MKTYNEQSFEAYIAETMQSSGWETISSSARQSRHSSGASARLHPTQPGNAVESLGEANGALLLEQHSRPWSKRINKGTLHPAAWLQVSEAKPCWHSTSRPLAEQESQMLYTTNRFQACRQITTIPIKIRASSVLAVTASGGHAGDQNRAPTAGARPSTNTRPTAILHSALLKLKAGLWCISRSILMKYT